MDLDYSLPADLVTNHEQLRSPLQCGGAGWGQGLKGFGPGADASSGFSHLVYRLCLIVALCCWGTAPVLAQVTREQALQALDSADPTVRRGALIELGRVGEMADADPLLEALRDDDPGVREAAEYAVWQVWARSGDTDVDVLLK